MPKLLEIDALTAEIKSLTQLLESAVSVGDIIGEHQLSQRLERLNAKFETLNEHTTQDNSASVALFFGGQPVLGSKGIAAEFAGSVIKQFQDLISKTFAVAEVGELGERGSIPFQAQSKLMVTGLARGSFGFVMDEMSDQTELASSSLSKIIDEATRLLDGVASQDETIFDEITEHLDGRTLLSLQELFVNLDRSQATIRIVEGDRDVALDSAAVHRARIRTEAMSIDEDTSIISGVLSGFLPIGKRFEITTNEGITVRGSASDVAVEQFDRVKDHSIGFKCTAEVSIKTIKPLNRPEKEVMRLISFTEIGSIDD